LFAKLFFKARSSPFGLSLFYPSKANTIIVQGMNRKISPSLLRKARGGSKTLSTLSVDQFFQAKVGQFRWALKKRSLYQIKG
jgi:hypothetical protein